MNCEANFFSNKITVCDKRDRARYNLRVKGKIWRKDISIKIIDTLVTQGLLSSFLSRPVA